MENSNPPEDSRNAGNILDSCQQMSQKCNASCNARTLSQTYVVPPYSHARVAKRINLAEGIPLGREVPDLSSKSGLETAGIKPVDCPHTALTCQQPATTNWEVTADLMISAHYENWLAVRR
jgi:hypothetical protein